MHAVLSRQTYTQAVLFHQQRESRDATTPDTSEYMSVSSINYWHMNSVNFVHNNSVDLKINNIPVAIVALLSAQDMAVSLRPISC